MIFYFSGTGNSKWAAMQLASLTKDRTIDITSEEATPDLQEEQQVGVVFPVYAWGMPEPMRQFVTKLGKTKAFTFGLCTCGADAGKTMKQLSRIYRLNSSYSLIMPNNYIIGSELEDEQEVRGKIQNARKELRRISEEILRRQEVYRVQEGTFARVKSGVIHAGFEKFARNTRPFYTTEACNGCGLCVRSCPARTISLANGKPVWGNQCYQCMHCIHYCPQQAVQYGKATKGRRRYTIEAYLTEEKTEES